MIKLSRRGLGRALATFVFASAVKSVFGEEHTINSPGEKQTQAAPNATNETESSQGLAVGRPRLREGTRVADLVGSVRQTGQRYTFFVEADGRRFVLLENLMLERIVRSQTNHPRTVQWKVLGTVTEFQGQNYLLIEHALLRGGLGEDIKAATPSRKN
ncbi:MAG: hypothetical protein ACUVQR_05280 [Thermogutta sp.]